MTHDGTVRLLASGDEAVVRPDGRPVLLSYARGEAGGTFKGGEVYITMSYLLDVQDKAGKVVAHKANVWVWIADRSERFFARWSC